MGITDYARDLTNMALSDFICADFDSLEGSSSYPVSLLPVLSRMRLHAEQSVCAEKGLCSS